MVFHYRNKDISTMIPFVKINNIGIERVQDFNYLGLYILQNDEVSSNKHHAYFIL